MARPHRPSKLSCGNETPLEDAVEEGPALQDQVLANGNWSEAIRDGQFGQSRKKIDSGDSGGLPTRTHASQKPLRGLPEATKSFPTVSQKSLTTIKDSRVQNTRTQNEFHWPEIIVRVDARSVLLSAVLEIRQVRNGSVRRPMITNPPPENRWRRRDVREDLPEGSDIDFGPP